MGIRRLPQFRYTAAAIDRAGGMCDEAVGGAQAHHQGGREVFVSRLVDPRHVAGHQDRHVGRFLSFSD
jgi:hypothetical protein